MSQATETFIPAGPHILVQKLAPGSTQQTKGGLILSGGPSRNEAPRGRVVAAPAAETVAYPTGAIIAYKPNQGYEVTLDGEAYLVINIEDILGTIQHPV